MSDTDKINPIDQKVINETSESASQSDNEAQAAVIDYSKKSKEELSMTVHVYSPFNNYFDGQAFSLTAVNATGPFDVLPKHHNFISLLKACDLIVRTVTQGENRIRISGGLIHVKADKVIIFLDV